ncbi:MAG TPA: GntR family transcriptional regulator, partial [Croceibacterium sp.]|nr:GntR family transcriptional regulator [Croceibacterium sp.]
MTIAERIYSASTSEDAEPARLAERLARLIEDDIASESAAAGGVMGSLRELSERYSVGRAAVREGVALLERRGLGRLRPGPYGGFIVAQPEAETIGGELADFFRMTGVIRTQL